MNNVEKKENKLKQFIKKHEFAFTIAGGVVMIAASVGLIYLGHRYISSIGKETVEKLAAKDKDMAALLEVCGAVDAGTRCSVIGTPSAGTVVTVAEYFGENTDEIIAHGAQPDDIIANVIFNIAKKPET